MECVTGCKTFTGGEIKHHKDCPYYPQSMSRIYDEMEAALSGLWIKVSDRLPENGQKVLFYSEEYHPDAVAGTYKNSEWHDDDFDPRLSLVTDEVTYWQPLPKPPKE